jgi:broad-specificity NMP kinase
MFNVCPNCGEYNDKKDVLSLPDRAVCLNCTHEQRFLSLPLYVITGASGSGKTTAALKLIERTHEFVILDQDILWTDAFNSPDNDYQVFRNIWLRMVKNIHQAGRSVVLFGSAIPQQYESCTERRYLSCIHYLALVCEPPVLEKRLLERPSWRKSGSPENLRQMLGFNKWLSENASQTKPRMKVLDTTNDSIDKTVASILDWLVEETKAAKVN